MATEAASPEPPILRARAQGRVSCDAAFEQLYAVYAPVVMGWTAMAGEAGHRDDIFQDVWTVFYRRWRGWQWLPEMDAPEARPVLSFLYRTFQFVLRGQRRSVRMHQPLEEAEVSDGARGPERLLQRVEFGRMLQLARDICTKEELEVLLAKLAGVPGREIARTLEVTEAVVDHRFRNTVARLRKRVQGKGDG